MKQSRRLARDGHTSVTVWSLGRFWEARDMSDAVVGARQSRGEEPTLASAAAPQLSGSSSTGHGRDKRVGTPHLEGLGQGVEALGVEKGASCTSEGVTEARHAQTDSRDQRVHNAGRRYFARRNRLCGVGLPVAVNAVGGAAW
jgi:hypothetical protein